MQAMPAVCLVLLLLSGDHVLCGLCKISCYFAL